MEEPKRGRPFKYGEPTEHVSVRVPKEHADRVRRIIKEYLENIKK